MNYTSFKGTGVALVTPFKNGLIDYSSLEKIIDHVISGGVDYVVVLGSTGEAATISQSEGREIIDCTIAKVSDRCPIVVGNFAGNNTLQLVEDISKFNFKGIDAILSSSPSYVKPSQEGIFQHYLSIEKACPVPIIIYNVPGRTNSNISWETTVRLANSSNKFIGIKEASGDLIQATRIAKNTHENFFLTSGDDELALPMLSIGGVGGISVIANALPQTFSEMISSALKADFQKAQSLNQSIYDLHKWLYIEGNPVGIKSALQILGLCSNEMRLPLVSMSTPNYKELERSLKLTL